MKVRVLAATFRDKYTQETFNRGDVIEITAERYKEIRKKGDIVEAVKTKESKPAADESQKTEESPADPPEPSDN